MLHRRKFLVGLVSALAAPAIVHAGNLMPIKRVVQALTEDEMHEILCKLMNTTIKNWQEKIAAGVLNRSDVEINRFDWLIGTKFSTFGIQPIWAKDFYK